MDLRESLLQPTQAASHHSYNSLISHQGHSQMDTSPASASDAQLVEIQSQHVAIASSSQILGSEGDLNGVTAQTPDSPDPTPDEAAALKANSNTHHASNAGLFQM